MVVILINHQQPLFAQKDSVRTSVLDSFLLNQKGIVGQLAQNLIADTTEDLHGRQRNDQAFQKYSGRIIRHIIIKPVDFGVSIGDTNKVFNNWLTRMANHLHWDTKDKVISDNLFFKQYDKLSPYLLGDNERYLRDLPYLEDARIKVIPVIGVKDSVDVLVLTKDLISVGGDVEVHNTKSASVTIKEDNFYGLGDRFQLQMLYDQVRSQHMGYGFDYIKRNIKGTFIDGAAGYLNFSTAFSSGRAEERMSYIKFSKLMVNPYMRWTYALDARMSATQNLYAADSVYAADYKYKANFIDAWVALNTSAGHIAGSNEGNRLRTSVSLRLLNQHFKEKPMQFSHQYYYPYADLKAVLGAFSLFKQNFYKIRYLYGFGRPEDVPQGIDATLKLGWTVKDLKKRPYMGIDLQRFFFSPSDQYFDFTIQAEGFFHKNYLEDVNLLGRVNFINYLHNINTRWKQRTFISAEIVRQFNGLLNEPVYPHQLYGVNNVGNQLVGGDWRAHLSGESVFYSPWSILYFKVAPFTFGDASIFRYYDDHAAIVDLYTAIGGGIRLRNESLILGTMEIKGWYFPKKNYNNERVVFQLNTKVRFTYNEKFIRRPEFIQLN
jgi:hypothetical protein